MHAHLTAMEANHKFNTITQIVSKVELYGYVGQTHTCGLFCSIAERENE
jgi:hypothetical protein